MTKKLVAVVVDIDRRIDTDVVVVVDGGGGGGWYPALLPVWMVVAALSSLVSPFFELIY